VKHAQFAKMAKIRSLRTNMNNAPAEFVALLRTICSVPYNAGKWTLGAGVSIVTRLTTMREVIGMALNTNTGTSNAHLFLASRFQSN
jgi:hypothetical protein